MLRSQYRMHPVISRFCREESRSQSYPSIKLVRKGEVFISAALLCMQADYARKNKTWFLLLKLFPTTNVEQILREQIPMQQMEVPISKAVCSGTGPMITDSNLQGSSIRPTVGNPSDAPGTKGIGTRANPIAFMILIRLFGTYTEINPNSNGALMRSYLKVFEGATKHYNTMAREEIVGLTEIARISFTSGKRYEPWATGGTLDRICSPSFQQIELQTFPNYIALWWNNKIWYSRAIPCPSPCSRWEALQRNCFEFRCSYRAAFSRFLRWGDDSDRFQNFYQEERSIM